MFSCIQIQEEYFRGFFNPFIIIIKMVKPKRSNKKFNKKEISFIKLNYKTMEYFELGAALGRTEASIRNKVYKLGFEDKIPKWTKAEEDWLKQIYLEAKGLRNLNLKKVSEALGRDDSNVCRKAKELGLTNECRKLNKEQVEKLRKNTTKWLQTHEHPKGMLGKYHSEWSKKEMSKSQLKVNRVFTDKERKRMSEQAKKNFAKFLGQNCYSRTRSGKRKDLGNTFFRSSWESNFARILNEQDKEWVYEPKGFDFSNDTTYYPDFYVNKDYYVEVKGWLDSKSKQKMKRFMKEYSLEAKKMLIVVNKENSKYHQWFVKVGYTNFLFYDELEKEYRCLEHWE